MVWGRDSQAVVDRGLGCHRMAAVRRAAELTDSPWFTFGTKAAPAKVLSPAPVTRRWRWPAGWTPSRPGAAGVTVYLTGGPSYTWL